MVVVIILKKHKNEREKRYVIIDRTRFLQSAGGKGCWRAGQEGGVDGQIS